jgi:hypothetical protein
LPGRRSAACEQAKTQACGGDREKKKTHPKISRDIQRKEAQRGWCATIAQHTPGFVTTGKCSKRSPEMAP